MSPALRKARWLGRLGRLVLSGRPQRIAAREPHSPWDGLAWRSMTPWALRLLQELGQTVSLTVSGADPTDQTGICEDLLQ